MQHDAVGRGGLAGRAGSRDDDGADLGIPDRLAQQAAPDLDGLDALDGDGVRGPAQQAALHHDAVLIAIGPIARIADEARDE